MRVSSRIYYLIAIFAAGLLYCSFLVTSGQEINYWDQFEDLSEPIYIPVNYQFQDGIPIYHHPDEEDDEQQQDGLIRLISLKGAKVIEKGVAKLKKKMTKPAAAAPTDPKKQVKKPKEAEKQKKEKKTDEKANKTKATPMIKGKTSNNTKETDIDDFPAWKKKQKIINQTEVYLKYYNKTKHIKWPLEGGSPFKDNEPYVNTTFHEDYTGWTVTQKGPTPHGDVETQLIMVDPKPIPRSVKQIVDWQKDLNTTTTTTTNSSSSSKMQMKSEQKSDLKKGGFRQAMKKHDKKRKKKKKNFQQEEPQRPCGSLNLELLITLHCFPEDGRHHFVCCSHIKMTDKNHFLYKDIVAASKDPNNLSWCSYNEYQCEHEFKGTVEWNMFGPRWRGYEMHEVFDHPTID